MWGWGAATAPLATRWNNLLPLGFKLQRHGCKKGSKRRGRCWERHRVSRFPGPIFPPPTFCSSFVRNKYILKDEAPFFLLENEFQIPRVVMMVDVHACAIPPSMILLTVNIWIDFPKVSPRLPHGLCSWHLILQDSDKSEEVVRYWFKQVSRFITITAMKRERKVLDGPSQLT